MRESPSADESAIGRVKCQVRLMEGVNPDTVWTWNAMGKRAGAWGLTPDGACAACGAPCPGVFEARPGTWGQRRLPVRLGGERTLQGSLA